MSGKRRQKGYTRLQRVMQRAAGSNIRHNVMAIRSQGAGEERMANPRRSQREHLDAKNAVRRKEMEEAIAEGSIVARQMTPQEREQSDARWAAATKRAAARKRR
jgi:hypothetical protein